MKSKQVRVKRGDAVGKVGNYDKAVAGGTTAHLHFEICRVPPDMPDNVGPSLVPYGTLNTSLRVPYDQCDGQGAGQRLTSLVRGW